MRASYAWLEELLGPLPPPGEVARLLTARGLEVESVEELGKGLRGALVAEVLDVRPAGRLTRAALRAGAREGSCLTGARNVRAGQRVPWAPPGTTLPDGRTLAAAQFHGEISEGMLLSPDEIGLGSSHEGVLVLPGEAESGADLAEFLALPDTVFEIALTPNFAQHCQSLRGIARELAAALGRRLPVVEPLAAAGSLDRPEVRVEDPGLCPLYAGGLLLRRADVPTPLWMQRRLWAAGMRPVSPVVDLTNYVMLEIGQPLHPFDLDKLAGGIRVRAARPGERLQTLDGVERQLEPQDIVIADREGGVALAGVMGSQRAEVDENTDRVFLEAAIFAPQRIQRTMRREDLRSEAAQRFAHGLAPDLPLRALGRIADLAPDVGWELAPGHLLVGRVAPEPDPITVEPGYVCTLLGMELSDAQQREALERMGFAVAEEDGLLQVRPPRDRIDVLEPWDVAEEVLRSVGIDRVAETLPPPAARVAEPPSYRVRSEVASTFEGLGYHSSVSYSLCDPSLLAALSRPAEVRLQNALTADASAMRTTLWAGLLLALRRNLSHGVAEIALCEVGRVFHRRGAQIEERESVALLRAGRRLPLSRFPEDKLDFYDLKGDVEAGLGSLRIAGLRFIPGKDPALHPGRQAEIFAGERSLGVMGEVHPGIADELDIDVPVLLWESSLDALRLSQAPRKASPLPRFPALVRDLAIVVEQDIPYAAVREVVRDALGERLVADRLFDIFQGAPVEPGKKSLGLRLTLRSAERTLTDADAEQAIGRLLQNLADRLGARLR